MKKNYTSPKAEKMEFNYSDAVVASGNKCENETHYSHSMAEGAHCTSQTNYYTTSSDN